MHWRMRGGVSRIHLHQTRDERYVPDDFQENNRVEQLLDICIHHSNAIRQQLQSSPCNHYSIRSLNSQHGIYNPVSAISPSNLGRQSSPSGSWHPHSVPPPIIPSSNRLLKGQSSRMLKVSRGSGQANRLVHDPLADVEVGVDPLLEVFVLGELVGGETGAGCVS